VRRARRKGGPVEWTFFVCINSIATPQKTTWSSRSNDRPEIVLQVLIVARAKGDSTRWRHFALICSELQSEGNSWSVFADFEPPKKFL